MTPACTLNPDASATHGPLPAARNRASSLARRLVRYCTRPPFALDRIEVLPDGRIAYSMKTARKGRNHRVMTAMEFMARLAALVPPPRIPLVRYHGVFASRSSWRRLVVLKPPQAAKPKPCASTPPVSTPGLAATTPPAGAASPAVPMTSKPELPAVPATPPPSGAALMTALALVSPEPAVAWGPLSPVVTVDPTTISVAHWGRLDNGELFARSRYIAPSTPPIRMMTGNLLSAPGLGDGQQRYRGGGSDRARRPGVAELRGADQASDTASWSFSVGSKRSANMPGAARKKLSLDLPTG